MKLLTILWDVPGAILSFIRKKKEVLKSNKLSYQLNSRIIDYARNIEGIKMHIID